MAVSLMNILGGNVNLSAANGADEPGKVTLTSNGDAAFDTIMAASELQEISAEQLAAYFNGQQTTLNDAQKATMQQLMSQLGSLQNGQNLPSDLVLTLQEVLPENVVQVIEQALELNKPAASFADLVAQLPNRELTPEELSEIVQKTGIPPVVIFAVLQDTPAASPELAANMVEDMGAAELLAKLPSAAAPVENAKQGAPLPVAPAMNDNADGASPDDAALLSVLSRIVQALTESKAPQPAQAVVAQPAITPTKQPKGEMGKVVDLTHMAATTPQNAVATPLVTEAEPVKMAAGSVTDPAGASLTVDAATSADSQISVNALAATGPKEAAPSESKFMAQLSQAPRPVPVTDQVLVNVRQAIADGTSRIEIKLNPMELGRVDVRIDTGADGEARIHITADRRDTLEMLQRDVRALERALNDVGMKTDANSLSFNLRGDQNQQHARGEQQAQDQNGKPSFELLNADGEVVDERLTASEMALTYDAGKTYRLNVDWGVDIRA